MNGFKTGRLVEPKTQSFNDKVYAESKVSFGYWSFWLGIKAKKGAWVYTSSGSKISFENWFKFEKSKKQKVASDYCAKASTGGKWTKNRCSTYFVHFICEFV